MRMISRLVVVGFLASTVPAYAVNPQHGLDLAKRWCVSCHVVSADQQRASTDAPPFSTIAHAPNFNARQLAYFLLEPHPRMPDLPLTRSAAEDIAAYIATLAE